MTETTTIKVPDIGDFSEVEVIEVLVKTGDQIEHETPLVTIESHKASMDIPSPAAGKVSEVFIKAGDKVSEGTDILAIEAAEQTGTESTGTGEPDTRAATAGEQEQPDTAKSETVENEAATDNTPAADIAPAEPTTDPRAPGQPPAGLPSGSQTRDNASARAHASPTVRRLARELGVELAQVRGSGRKGRITKEDVKAFTKAVMSGNRDFGASGGFALPEIPAVDFSKFGPVENRPLSRLRRLTGQHLQRSWLSVPQVTQFNKADITDLEAFRHSKLEEAEQHDVKLTLISFLLKAVVVVLEKYPEFNASLAASGEELILKQYFHIGVAVNTDDGLVVPVIRDVDQKGLFELAREIGDKSERARNNQLKRDDIEGGCFTISSLGGVGGSYFTPIVNTPEVAILGVSRATMQPVHDNGSFVPRLLLPFALSYDHRVIDGVAGARFTEELRTVLTDIRHILL
ncbi:pyruvate dehydrogenase E2 component (dihydrolipoamide acetyltransferase) [Methylohalomonas lacus]|uniref:Dihydrolipoamide acetyltransferase component of pyruvate dehydrogenase complex n=1 Tax=Methylohalomonas lacus TaxID=398773 RepID=A0AAE3L0N7_9GAMM|nr:2-oxo acid dehydrogenase subunit E2 [Methylohalomonas lacus]MCS3902844.1 pyruvate dehydrogenase E2 component (dihydrolipoamide acetyltransferase) [Methylohalomonas lacus]